MNFKTILIIVVLFVSLQLKAADKYNISIKITGYQDTVMLLTTYYGDKILLVDTAYVENTGSFTFSGNDLLPGGIYMAVSQKKHKLFEFIVNENQQFKLSTDTIAYSMNMQVQGSPENKLFFDYMKFNEKQFRNSKLTRDSLHLETKGSEKYESLKTKLGVINDLTADYKINIISEYPDFFITSLFKAMREVEVPDSITQIGDSTASYLYYKKHFWDYFDLTDPRLLHTPMFAKKVDQYFDKLIVVHPDSAIAAIDEIIQLARPSQEVVSWLVWHFVSEYQNPKYMGFDVVFIHLADEYFQKEKILNSTPSITQTIVDQANKMRPLVLGSPAPNLIMIDTSGNYQSFNNLTNDYIVLFFWDFDCGICKGEIKGLKDLLIEDKFDIGVFAINVNSELDKWNQSIIEQEFIWSNVNGTRSVTEDFHDLYDIHGTPALFILDRKRAIIAKQISSIQVNTFIKNHEKRMKIENK